MVSQAKVEAAHSVLKTILTTAVLNGVKVSHYDKQDFTRWIDEGLVTLRVLKNIMYGHHARGKRARRIVKAISGPSCGPPGGLQAWLPDDFNPDTRISI